MNNQNIKYILFSSLVLPLFYLHYCLYSINTIVYLFREEMKHNAGGSYQDSFGFVGSSAKYFSIFIFFLMFFLLKELSHFIRKENNRIGKAFLVFSLLILIVFLFHGLMMLSPFVHDVDSYHKREEWFFFGSLTFFAYKIVRYFNFHHPSSDHQ